MSYFVTDMAAKRAEISPDKVAFRNFSSDAAWTFADIDALAEGAVAGFTEIGLRKSDRIAIVCHNRVEFFIALFACQKGGFILIPLNWRQPVAELDPIVEMTAPRAILYDREFAATAKQLGRGMKRISFHKDSDADMCFSAFGRKSTVDKRRIDGQKPWYLLFTSGTTGMPKAVIQTAEMAWANTVNIGQAIGLTPDDTSANYLPLFHTAGINLHTLPVFLTGGASHVLPKFQPDDLFTLIGQGDISKFMGVPAIYQAFSQHPKIDETDLSRVGSWACGGAPLPAPLVTFFAERGVRICNGFGMTETGPTVFLQDRDSVETKIGSVGKAQMLVDVRIDNPDPETGQGELQMRGPGITPGYFENEQATQDTFTKDGWLKSGDVARRDEDGYFYIVDRIKDMFISGGENVYPAEVEQLLYRYPGILEAAVVGVPDEQWGEVGSAFLLAEKDHSIDTDALMAWCRERIAGYKVPKFVHLVDEFPRTAAGKIKKHELRDMIRDR